MYNGNVYFGGGGVSTNIIFKKVAQRKNSLMQKERNNMINGELVVDNFAGGGGASTGIELATGYSVDIAINHDPEAIKMHKVNHPNTKHYCENVWEVDPVKACKGHPVGLAWFSPDCKHFSKAKGGKPVEKNIRGLAWVVLKWAALVRPRVIMLENVEEFQTWGPCIPIRDKDTGRVIVSMVGRHDREKNEPRTRVADPGEVVPVDRQIFQPDPKRSGQTYKKWRKQLEALGYEIDTKELVAADYGAPTMRKRFFMIARCDGKPIVLPESEKPRTLYLLAASATSDKDVIFNVQGNDVKCLIPYFSGFTGQWGWQGNGYLKGASVAYAGTHRHNKVYGNEPYVFTYMFKIALPVPEGCTRIELPDDKDIMIFAATVSDEKQGKAILNIYVNTYGSLP
jgi:site-specific DNA-cytosine methylase